MTLQSNPDASQIRNLGASAFRTLAERKGDFVSVNPDAVGPTGCIHHTSECATMDPIVHVCDDFGSFSLLLIFLFRQGRSRFGGERLRERRKKKIHATHLFGCGCRSVMDAG
jgi:hypothetical protein